MVTTPTKHFGYDNIRTEDIVCGRGRGFYERPGNVKWRNIIQSHFDAYLETDRDGRERVAFGIILDLQTQGCRFLGTDNAGHFFEMTNKDAMMKTKQAFANMKKEKERKRQRQAASEDNMTEEDLGRMVEDSFQFEVMGEFLENELLQTAFTSVVNIVHTMCKQQEVIDPTEQVVESILSSGDLKSALRSIVEWKRNQIIADKNEAATTTNSTAPEEQQQEAQHVASKMTSVPESNNVITLEERSKVLPNLEIRRNWRWKKDRNYTGTVLRGKPHGMGSMSYDDGRFVCGNWDNGIIQGKACVLYTRGSSYYGNFERHKRHGQGVQIFANDEKYWGDFVQDQRHGSGTYKTKQGSEYRGDFVNGDFTYGFVRYPNGSCQAGRFENWQCIDTFNSGGDGDGDGGVVQSSSPFPNGPQQQGGDTTTTIDPPG